MKKRGKSESMGSLDSLLDTMTNVIGILVIVLVVTQLGVGDAVKRISENLPDISIEQLELAKSEAADLERLLAELGKQETEIKKALPKDPEAIKEQQKLIASLKRDLEEVLKASVDLEDLRKQVEERRQQVSKLEQEITQGEEEVSHLRAVLDDTPEPGPAPPPRNVMLPNPRPAPQGAKPVHFMCRAERIIYLDQDGLNGLALTAVRIVQGKNKGGTVDCKKLAEHFDKRKVGDRLFHLQAKVVNGVPYIVPEARKDAGETIAKFQRPSSLYQGKLRQIDPRKQYASYLVWNDSFDTYIEARKLAMARNIAAGWVPYDKGFEWRMKLNVPMTCSDQPPPKKTSPPAPKPASPSQPPHKPLPPDTID